MIDRDFEALYTTAEWYRQNWGPRTRGPLRPGDPVVTVSCQAAHSSGLRRAYLGTFVKYAPFPTRIELFLQPQPAEPTGDRILLL